MLELKTVQEIIEALKWISTLGNSDIKEVKNDVEELVSELSKSLANLWDVVCQVTSIKEDEFSKESFSAVYDYFVEFYLGMGNLMPARTYCGNVRRTVGRIKFKFAKFLHTDVGKWDEVDAALRKIVKRDGDILAEYETSIRKLDYELKEIKGLLVKKEVVAGKNRYFGLKSDLEDNIRLLKSGTEEMSRALDHINSLAG